MQRKPRPPKLAPLTDEQNSLADEIQKRWVDPSRYDDCPMAIHISQALAQVIDGIRKNEPPPRVLESMAVLKFGYLTLFGDQHMAILAHVLGDRETVKQVLNHENGRVIVNRIFDRTGPVEPGMAIPDVEVVDILEEEGFYS